MISLPAFYSACPSERGRSFRYDDDILLLSLEAPLICFLQYLSILPSTGFDVEHLASIAGLSIDDAQDAVDASAAAGITSFVNKGRTVRFTHDRQQLASTRSIAPEAVGRVHRTIASFLLSSPVLSDRFLFDAVDNLAAAREAGSIGSPSEDDQLAELGT